MSDMRRIASAANVAVALMMPLSAIVAFAGMRGLARRMDELFDELQAKGDGTPEGPGMTASAIREHDGDIEGQAMPSATGSEPMRAFDPHRMERYVRESLLPAATGATDDARWPSGPNGASNAPLPASDAIRCCKVLVELELRRYHLSKVEKSVARRILASDSNEAISERLFISESMVKYHARNIYKKADCDNRSMFFKTIMAGIESSDRSWEGPVDLARDMERYHVT